MNGKEAGKAMKYKIAPQVFHDKEDKPKFFIDIESKKDEDLFFEKLQMIDDNVCVITDNIQLAKKIWSLNKNQNVIQKPMVALKVINKETVSPFF